MVGPDLHKRIRLAAIIHDRKVKDLVADMLEEGLKKLKPKGP